MLADNMALVQCLHELSHHSSHSLAATSTKLRDIQDLLTWTYSFLSFIALAVKTDHKETKKLMGYAQIIIQIAWQHGGLRWRSYDTRFRKQLATGVPLEWTQVDLIHPLLPPQ